MAPSSSAAASYGTPSTWKNINEAAETADLLRLMRLFGITEKTAMHYVTAAHPERTAKLLR
ncbi:hypothetical protein SSP24_00040 [Streptomyces spinoverrucosus]|uniref:Uncharacterized protein n=1 Tax=Streptomyces spinoverrucosus TaxID=284043 RepID=A0A4Y3V9N1_9ACTN|nr:hypothetical protein SSP24_00040 [Streptomyces spinoverrucosus]GHB43613.1 hypothetical protein GCM10010397_12550 [Streptomyces spinoverrucosus]